MDGILVIDKPAGLTSHDVVVRVRRILNERRVGHTGTLDPFATGVLVILVGRATRLAQFLSRAIKSYEAVIRFGFRTETGDSTGARVETDGTQNENGARVHVWSESEIESALARLRGEIDQVPPMYSAKKVEGRKLYELARRGVEVERSAVRVIIHELEAVEEESRLLRYNEGGTSDLSIRVACSSGTYIRTLAESIGELLGAPAHLLSLRRTRAGDFGIENAVSLEQFRATMEESDGVADSLLPMDAALSELPFVHLTADEARKSLHGIALRLKGDIEAEWRDNQPVRMRDADGHLIAVGFFDAASRNLHPRVVLFPEK